MLKFFLSRAAKRNSHHKHTSRTALFLGTPIPINNSPKRGASNRARHDYEGRWGIKPPSTQSWKYFLIWKKLGDKDTGTQVTASPLPIFTVDSHETNSTHGQSGNCWTRTHRWVSALREISVSQEGEIWPWWYRLKDRIGE